jgi:hypothetical protein
MENFANGTIELVSISTAKGGGDSAAVKQFGLEDKMICFYRVEELCLKCLRVKYYQESQRF